MIEASNGRIETSTGRSEAGNGRIETSTERSEAGNGKTETSTGRIEMVSGRTDADTISSCPLVSSMSLNDNKAGMEGLDKERINKIIYESSKGSKFYENERRKEQVLNSKIQQQKSLAESMTASQLQYGYHQADQLLRDLEEKRDLSHTIVHVDMDAFYAAVEMRDDPSLRDKPMAVGSSSMLSTSNYIARRFGIRAAMPGFIGRKLCPELVIVPLNFDKYIAVSETVKDILAVYDPDFSAMSLDEAYLDFTEHLRERKNSPLSSRTFLLRTQCSSDSSALLRAQCSSDSSTLLRAQCSSDSSTLLRAQCSSDSSALLRAQCSSDSSALLRTQCSSDSSALLRAQCSSDSSTLLRTQCSSDSSALCMCDLNLVLRPVVLQEIGLASDRMKLVESVQDVNQLLSQCVETEHLKTCSVCMQPFPSFMLKVYGVSAEDAVLEMRNRIEQRTHLTASAGIAPNTMLAKICSDRNKPNGQFQIEPIKEHVQEFISGLPVRKIPGIGKVTEKLLEAVGVTTCQDLYRHRALLYHLFSPTSFHHFMNIALGIGSSTLERDGDRKSISTEQTFGELSQPRDLLNKCQELCQCLSRDLKRDRYLGKTVTLKIKTVGFEVKTRAHTISHYSNDEKTIFTTATRLLESEIEHVQPECLRLRLMGVRMSKLVSETNCSSSVASFFEKQCRDNSAWPKDSTVTSSSAEETKRDSSQNRDVTAASWSSHYSFMPFTGNCSQQQDYDDDDDGDDDGIDFQECIGNNKILGTAHINTARIKTKDINYSQPLHHKRNNKMNKQDNILHFLCSKQSSLSLGESICNCGQCMFRRSLNVSSTTRDTDSANAASEGTESVSEASQVDSVNRASVGLVHVNQTSQGTGYVNSTPVDKQTVNHKPQSSPGEQHQQPSVSPAPRRVQKAKPFSAEAAESGGMIHCPVCGQQKYQWPLDQLNAHMDLCLSRSTVREILTDQQGLLPQKRPRSTQVSDSRSDKRTKTQHTLLSYFKP